MKNRGYKLIDQLYQKHYGYVRIYANDYKLFVIQKTYKFLNYQNALKLCNSYNGFQKNKLTYIIKGKSLLKKQKGFAQLTFKFQQHNRCLEKQLQKRKQLNIKFAQNQLWYIIQQLSQILKIFQQYNIYHGDLSPFTIFITNEGRLQVHNPTIFLPPQQYFMNLYKKNKSYLSPQVLQLIGQRNTDFNQIDIRTDIFSMGIILLYMCTLKQPYNYLVKQDTENINKLIKQVQRSYSHDLCNFIKKCLITNHSQRGFPNQLLTQMKSFQQYNNSFITQSQKSVFQLLEKQNKQLENDMGINISEYFSTINKQTVCIDQNGTCMDFKVYLNIDHQSEKVKEEAIKKKKGVKERQLQAKRCPIKVQQRLSINREQKKIFDLQSKMNEVLQLSTITLAKHQNYLH